MKSYLFSFAYALCTLGLFAQSEATTIAVSIGDVYKIGPSETTTYKHLEIPKPNIIRKRGGFPNNTDLKGLVVEVTAVKEKDGTTEVTIKPKDGTRFFGSHKWIKADLNAALAAGELQAY